MKKKSNLPKHIVRTTLRNQVGILVSAFLLIQLVACNKQIKPLEANTAEMSGNAYLANLSNKNIILVILDDYGFELPAYAGGQSYSTPNMDYIATNGIWFSQCFSHPDGSPSRLALQTGKYNFRNYTGWGNMGPNDKCIGNMLSDAGYQTCFAGKWQLGDGDAGIRNHGYNNYLVYLPTQSSNDQRFHRYKNPYIYANGRYLSDAEVAGKYSEDMYVDYITNFIDSNKTRPFFITYCPVLVGRPFVPTPDDPEFATWNPDNDVQLSDTKYFASMVKYADKKIGALWQKIKDEGLENNTIIMFTADNTTPKGIKSIYKGVNVPGGKNLTSQRGTNVPLAVMAPGTIPAGQTSSTLVDFTDFMPSIADIAGVSIPLDYGVTDGHSFYDNLRGIQNGDNRDWVFCQWDNNPSDKKPIIRYINNAEYKLYDTVANNSNYSRFYNIKKDANEKRPIADSLLTPDQKSLKQSFIVTLNSMH